MRLSNEVIGGNTIALFSDLSDSQPHHHPPHHHAEGEEINPLFATLSMFSVMSSSYTR